MDIVIPVYAEQALSPRAAEVLRAITDSARPDDTIKYRPFLPTDKKVLVFGRAPSGVFTGVEFIQTYSIAQMMSKPNALTVIGAALRQFIEEPDPYPFRGGPLGTVSPLWVDTHLDFDRPTAVDIETDGNFSDGDTPETVNIISVAFYQDDSPPIVLHNGWDGTRMQPLSWIQIEELARTLVKFDYLIFHNGKFDIRVMNRVFKVCLKNSFDTMLAHHVLNHAAGDHKLKHLAQRYLGAPEWEAGLSKYTVKGGHFEFIPEEKLIEYNGWDVYWTFKLWEFLAPQIAQDDDNIKAFNLEMSAADFLLSVEQAGIPFDTDYAAEYENRLLAGQAMDLARLRDIARADTFNPNSPKQVKEAIYRLVGVVLGSSNEETLLAAKKEYKHNVDFVNFVDLLLSYRKAGKIAGTYIKGWRSQIGPDGRVHPTFLVHGTSTGRLSSTKPNAQNVPRDKEIRKLVTLHAEATILRSTEA